MRVSICILLCLVVVSGGDDAVTSPLENLLQSVSDVFPVLCDIFYSVFGAVNRLAFRAALSAAVRLVDLTFPPQPPPRVPERWWGERDHQDTSIRRFTVHFSDEVLVPEYKTPDLEKSFGRERCQAIRLVDLTFPPQPPPRIPERWWGERDHQDTSIRRFTVHFSDEVGLDIHFIHVKPLNPRRKKVLPLLMLHGFPVTAFEFVHVIQDLLMERDGSDFVFEMIVPHLPGYGYSEATYKIGLAPYQMGIIMKNLMLRLRKPQFYIHAGDVGQAVGDAIAVLFPKRVLGLHTNFPFSIRPRTLAKLVLGQLFPPAVVEKRYEDRLYPLSARLRFYLEQFGYFHLQASKPDNVGHGLDDSPVAHASWLIQNLMMATDPAGEKAIDGSLPANYDMDDFCDSFTVHWACRSMTTAARSYAEMLAVHQDPLSIGILMTPTPVPFAAINFRHELIYQPDDFLRDKYPALLQSTTLDFGGHFAAYQVPAVLADSIWTSVAKMELFHGKRTSVN